MQTQPVTYPVDGISEGLILPDRVTLAGQKTYSEVRQEPREMPDETKMASAEKTADNIALNMNKVAAAFNARLAFSVDETTGKTVIKVIDKETDEIIRQIPPEEMLRLIRKMRDVMGLLLDIEL